ncbi:MULTISPECIES: GH39 family glycosyl hydrolase [unclassified Microbacterium]|uniref:GH39 family glycosyl hydrolase n=1 Tax=unclassified Microbacterium TaxID=2609290 RepID=UPI003015D7E4
MPLTSVRIDGFAVEDSPLTHVWNACVGAGRANEALRADWQEHFRDAVSRLGMRSVRFHGLFHDDMFVYRARAGSGFGPDADLGEELYTFSYVDKVFDFLLSTGTRPFVELGFMPRDLATDHDTVFWWKAHASPPKDMDAWVRLVVATVEHWIDRYGIDEVSQWKFEVWNEPNLVPHFWTGTKTQYFELYAATVRAIKAIDPVLQVGGPSTSVFVPDGRYDGETEDLESQFATAAAEDVDALDWKPVWIEEFLAWCAERDLPVDFVTTHVYPTDYAFGVSGEATLISRYADATRDDLTVLRALVAGSAYPEAEVHITEWSTTPSSRDRIHDTVYAATYIVRAYLQSSELAESISYWTFTDVFEEGGAGIGPFHGGFGIVNEQGIPKPTFHAFAALARLGDRRLLSTDHGVIAGDSRSGAVSAVFFNYPAEMGTRSVGSRDTYEQTHDLRGYGPARRVRHTLDGLAPGAVFHVEVLDLEHGDVAEAWHRMGEPVNLTLPQTSALREVADGLERFTLVADDGGRLEIDLELQPWAVASLVQE